MAIKMASAPSPYLIQKLSGKEPLGGSKFWAIHSLAITVILLIIFIALLISGKAYLSLIPLVFATASFIKYLIFKRKNPSPD